MRDVTDDSFDREIVGAAGAMIVDVWAPWCPPCRMLEPVLEQLAREHPDIGFVRLNADENPRTAARYRALALPVLLVFQGGELVKTLIGAKPKPALEAALATILGAIPEHTTA